MALASHIAVDSVHFPRTAPGLRATLEALIEQAIALLDEIDGDADLEPEVDDDKSDYEPEPYW